MSPDPIHRREFLGRAAKIGGATLAAPSIWSAASPRSAGASETGRPPNVLFILTDQQRFDSLGAYGNPWVTTPHLDRLAAEGMVFDRAYATQPVCSPCRSSVLTGRWPHSTGVTENCDPSGPAPPLGLDERIWPLELQRAGYAGCYIGKWHLSEVDAWGERFDRWEGFQTGGGHWIGDRYKTDVQTEWGIEFMREHRDHPFCLFMSYYPPHTPRTAPEEYIEPYRADERDQPEYYGMVSKIDDNVGDLVACLEELGVRDRTLVVFTSDHGDSFGLRWNHHSKRLCYDVAAKVPLIMSRPGVIPAGARRADLVSSADLGPTVLDLCGARQIPGPQGRSAATIARGGNVEDWRDAVCIENFPIKPDHSYTERSVTSAEWKLILDSRRPPELYHLPDDAQEVRNLYGNEGTEPIVRGLVERLQQWAKATGDETTPELVDNLRADDAPGA